VSEQLPLLEALQREEKPWKRTHGTSRAVVQKKERDGSLNKMRNQTLRCLLAMTNRTNASVTSLELEIYMWNRGEFKDLRAFQVRARLNELADGWWVRRRVRGGGPWTKDRVGGGLIERARDVTGELIRRRSVVNGEPTGFRVLTWRPREKGSQERGPSNT
jgi:hypothetical protein